LARYFSHSGDFRPVSKKKNDEKEWLQGLKKKGVLDPKAKREVLRAPWEI
jgi:hypothetical protein